MLTRSNRTGSSKQRSAKRYLAGDPEGAARRYWAGQLVATPKAFAAASGQ